MKTRLFNFVIALTLAMSLLLARSQSANASTSPNSGGPSVSAALKCQTTTWSAYIYSKTLNKPVAEYTQNMYWCYDGKKVSNVKVWTTSSAGLGWKLLSEYPKVGGYRNNNTYYYSETTAKFGYLCVYSNCSATTNLTVKLTPYYYGNIGKFGTIFRSFP